MHRYFKPASSRDLRVFAFLESPERCGGPKENAGDYDRSCYSSTFAVAFRPLCKFEWDLRAINCDNIAHLPGECSCTAPTAALLGFSNASGCSRSRSDNCYTVDFDWMNHGETYSTP